MSSQMRLGKDDDARSIQVAGIAVVTSARHCPHPRIGCVLAGIALGFKLALQLVDLLSERADFGFYGPNGALVCLISLNN